MVNGIGGPLTVNASKVDKKVDKKSRDTWGDFYGLLRKPVRPELKVLGGG